jgi:hypothetical protein
MSVQATRVFLGWDRPLLHSAADWLIAQGDELPQMVVAVPGRQAKRRLLELLVDHLPGGVPPRLVTAGVLVDELVGPRGRVAGRAARTLAWADALASLPADRLAELVTNPPAHDDLRGWRELGAMARGLHGLLGAADRDFADAVEPAGRLAGPSEAQRWQVLARARKLYLERLTSEGLVDPHESRRAAVAAAACPMAGDGEGQGGGGREQSGSSEGGENGDHAYTDGAAPGTFHHDAQVILVGVVEAGDEGKGSLLRAALGALSTPPTALVFAPESESPRFDDLGCVRPSPAGDAPPEVPLDLDHWHVEDRPADQAERAVRCLAALDGRHPAAQITVGLLDDQVGPPLSRRLADLGVTVRDVAGTPVTRSGPAHLLAATADWLRDRSVDAFAALVRHPDLLLESAEAGGPLAVAVEDDPSLPVPPGELASSPCSMPSLFDDDPSLPVPPGDLPPPPGATPSLFDDDPSLPVPPGDLAPPRSRCLASDLDDYRAAHLPEDVSGPWLAQGSVLDESTATRRQLREAADERDRRRALQAASRAVDAQLGDLARGRARPLVQWVEPLRAWLDAVYGSRELEPQAREVDRRLAASLRAVAEALDELSSASAWTRPVSAADAVDELHAALSGAIIPPAPADDAVELQGWLELPLDDAPVLVLTGVNDGRLPEPTGDLPEALAAELGLPDDRARLARDAFLLTAMLHAREHVSLITGRRSTENDPLRPSRLLFACDDEALPERVARLVAGGRVRRPAGEVVPGREESGPAGAAKSRREESGRVDSRPADSGRAETGRTASGETLAIGSQVPLAHPRPLPMAAGERTVGHLSVTAFARYLQSPYRFYLDRVLHLGAADDGAAEMNPLVFGTLAHAVLEGLATHPAGRSTKAAVVDAFLQERLDVLAAERFGSSSRGAGKGKGKSKDKGGPLPAVTLQLMHLRARLAAFARWQANWAAAGWRIRHAEWEPSQPVTLDVDGEPFRITGVIDRIDENEQTGAWAILDYKTSEVGADPADTHRATVPDPTDDEPKRRTGVWVDLQLPLYRVLAAELELPSDVRLGYVNLPADLDDVGEMLAPQEDIKQGRKTWEGWTPERLDEALDVARHVIRGVRAGKFEELGEVTHPRADEPIVRALAGLDLLSAPAPKVTDDEAGGEGAS